MEKFFSVNDLLKMNDMLLQRGAPNQEDGIGYNKADYGACSNYFYGCSDAQIADLAKRLVKYSNTQLHIDKQLMKDTADYYASLVKDGYSREDGISIDITENGTMISFKYNETFIDIIKSQPRRQFDRENKQWIVPNDRVIPALNELYTVGADVDNALSYATNHPLMKDTVLQDNRIEVLTKFEGDNVFLKFDYNKDIIESIKEINYSDRKWNPQHKFWTIKKNHLDYLKEILSNVAKFKVV